MTERPTIVLVSGGPDSATLTEVIAKRREKAGGGAIHGLYLRSGFASDDQEITAARELIENAGGKLEVIDISDVVKRLNGGRVLMHAGANISSYGYTTVLSIAASYAVVHGYRIISVGVHKDDSYANPEYGESYLHAFQALLRSSDPMAPAIDAPFLSMTKAEVFSLGASLGVKFGQTWSCIEGRALHCGSCGACRARRAAFKANGLNDPTRYIIEPNEVADPHLPILREAQRLGPSVN